METKKLFDFKNPGKEAPSEELSAEFKRGGISFLDHKWMADIVETTIGKKLSLEDKAEALKSFQGVSIDIAVGDQFIQENVPAFSIKVRFASQGRDVYFTNFRLQRIEDQNVLTFSAYLYIPERVMSALPGRERGTQVVGLSFLDLCFGGAQEIQALDTDTTTPRRPGVPYADIGWMLPSRYVDVLIDAMGRLNDTMFDGMLRESIIYTKV